MLEWSLGKLDAFLQANEGAAFPELDLPYLQDDGLYYSLELAQETHGTMTRTRLSNEKQGCSGGFWLCGWGGSPSDCDSLVYLVRRATAARGKVAPSWCRREHHSSARARAGTREEHAPSKS